MSTTTKLDLSSDLTFTDYNIWQKNSVVYENIRDQSLQLKPTDKYIFDGVEWSIPDYEGFAIISTVNSNPGNELFFKQLLHLKENLKTRLDNLSYYWLPEDSYHQTIANTLSNEKYYKNIKEPGLLDNYPGLIEKALNKITIPQHSSEINLKLIGFNVFGSCIALLGIIENEHDYDRIISFRRQFYSDSELNNIGIKYTRPFIGHITFAYLGKELTEASREDLAKILSTLNSTIESMNIIFKISLTELRYFKNLSNFQMKPGYPCFNFIKK